jgi:hypothetical protein
MKKLWIGSMISLALAASSLVAGCGGSDSSDDDSTGSSAGSSGNGGEGGSGVGEGGTPSSEGGEGGTPASADCTKRGPIDEDTTWKPLDECRDGFDVPSTIEVEGSGTTLTIEPGVKLKFQDNVELDVQPGASLVAVGTEESPILFTGWQEAPGSWGGVVFYSNAVSNEIAYATVEYAGADDGPSGAITLSEGDTAGRAKLSHLTIRNNARFGLTVLEDAELGLFEDNTITENEGGAIRVEVTAVDQLAGDGNSIEENGPNGDNVVQLETSILLPIVTETTWPNLSPAIYRVTGPNGDGGNQIYLEDHLTIEPGAVFEFAGGSGIDVSGGTSGLSAIGTEEEPIIFRGIDGSGWSGIGFCESNWTGNNLTYVEVHNAKGPPDAWSLCGTGATDVLKPGILVGDNGGTTSFLHIENITVAGPNNADADIGLQSSGGTPSELEQAGTNVGTGDADALVIEEF